MCDISHARVLRKTEQYFAIETKIAPERGADVVHTVSALPGHRDQRLEVLAKALGSHDR